PLLNIINFQTLIATKAARVCEAACGEPVLEFGLRRAQGIDGALAAARAAYVGGCAGTSNVLAGKLFGIPVRGTHAHSWVMFFPDERASFAAYAAAMPNNCVFLVDTYDTLDGVRHAIAVGRELRARGHELVGVRLDSGDLAHLSIEARKLLDQAGFPDAAIVASNDLDEGVITSLKQQGAAIAMWGVGTKLVTADEQPALGGVYKLAAVAGPDGSWEHKIKLSEQSIKVTNPGILQVRRLVSGGRFVADVIYDRHSGVTGGARMHDIGDPTLERTVDPWDGHEDLLCPVVAGGQRTGPAPSLAEVRTRARRQLDHIDPRTRRFLNPQTYPVGLDPVVHERKQRLIAQARAQTPSRG
ncbi:MAG: nicotinate phosphoribosyltransferase, partial [Myxococcota bacterium]